MLLVLAAVVVLRRVMQGGDRHCQPRLCQERDRFVVPNAPGTVVLIRRRAAELRAGSFPSGQTEFCVRKVLMQTGVLLNSRHFGVHPFDPFPYKLLTSALSI